MRVIQHLTDRHVRFETLLHAPAFTATRLAKFLHISGRQVVKCVLLAAGQRFHVAVVPAMRQLGWPAVDHVLGSEARLASEDEIACWFSDCEHGSLVPFGSLYGLPTLLDETVGEHMVFQSQRRSLAVRLATVDFLRLEQPRRVALTH